MARKQAEILDVKRFMRAHWQREPLLVRGAFPAFEDPLSPRELEVVKLIAEGLTSEEIAEQLQLPRGRLEELRSRGRVPVHAVQRLASADAKLSVRPYPT